MLTEGELTFADALQLLGEREGAITSLRSEMCHLRMALATAEAEVLRCEQEANDLRKRARDYERAQERYEGDRALWQARITDRNETIAALTAQFVEQGSMMDAIVHEFEEKNAEVRLLEAFIQEQAACFHAAPTATNATTSPDTERWEHYLEASVRRDARDSAMRDLTSRFVQEQRTFVLAAVAQRRLLEDEQGARLSIVLEAAFEAVGVQLFSVAAEGFDAGPLEGRGEGAHSIDKWSSEEDVEGSAQGFHHDHYSPSPRGVVCAASPTPRNSRTTYNHYDRHHCGRQPSSTPQRGNAAVPSRSRPAASTVVIGTTACLFRGSLGQGLVEMLTTQFAAHARAREHEFEMAVAHNWALVSDERRLVHAAAGVVTEEAYQRSQLVTAQLSDAMEIFWAVVVAKKEHELQRTVRVLLSDNAHLLDFSSHEVFSRFELAKNFALKEVDLKATTYRFARDTIVGAESVDRTALWETLRSCWAAIAEEGSSQLARHARTTHAQQQAAWERLFADERHLRMVLEAHADENRRAMRVAFDFLDALRREREAHFESNAHHLLHEEMLRRRHVVEASEDAAFLANILAAHRADARELLLKERHRMSSAQNLACVLSDAERWGRHAIGRMWIESDVALRDADRRERRLLATASLLWREGAAAEAARVSGEQEGGGRAALVAAEAGARAQLHMLHVDSHALRKRLERAARSIDDEQLHALERAESAAREGVVAQHESTERAQLHHAFHLLLGSLVFNDAAGERLVAAGAALLLHAQCTTMDLCRGLTSSFVADVAEPLRREVECEAQRRAFCLDSLLSAREGLAFDIGSVVGGLRAWGSALLSNVFPQQCAAAAASEIDARVALVAAEGELRAALALRAASEGSLLDANVSLQRSLALKEDEASVLAQEIGRELDGLVQSCRWQANTVVAGAAGALLEVRAASLTAAECAHADFIEAWRQLSVRRAVDCEVLRETQEWAAAGASVTLQRVCSVAMCHVDEAVDVAHASATTKANLWASRCEAVVTRSASASGFLETHGAVAAAFETSLTALRDAGAAWLLQGWSANRRLALEVEALRVASILREHTNERIQISFRAFAEKQFIIETAADFFFVALGDAARRLLFEAPVAAQHRRFTPREASAAVATAAAVLPDRASYEEVWPAYYSDVGDEDEVEDEDWAKGRSPLRPHAELTHSARRRRAILMSPGEDEGESTADDGGDNDASVVAIPNRSSRASSLASGIAPDVFWAAL